MDLRWWLDAAAFLGIAVLSVPVWSLNFRKKRAARTAARPAPGPGFRARVRQAALAKRQRAVAEWRAIDEVCLGAGYLLLLGSAALRLVLPA